jgi:hypothetical protein
MREQSPFGRQPRPRIKRAVLVTGILLSVVGMWPGSSSLADTNDGITLLLHHGATPANVSLSWSGGSPAYEVYRSASAATLVTSANKLGETDDSTWADVPPPGGVQFYEVRLKSNHPPVLASIGNKTAPMGQTLTFTITATDPDSDPVTLSVTPSPLPAHATFDGTTGAFSFRPTTDEVGSINLTFIASDGELTDSETITITVSPPGATTTFSGRLLDATSAAAGFTVPVVTATVSILGTPVSGTSNSQGFFTLTDVPLGHQVLDIATATPLPAPVTESRRHRR